MKPVRDIDQIVAEAQSRGKLTRGDVYEALRKYGEKSTQGKRRRIKTFLGQIGRMVSDGDKQKVLDDLDSYPNDY